MSGSGPRGPSFHGVWQSLQPMILTRYAPRSRRAVSPGLAGVGAAVTARAMALDRQASVRTSSGVVSRCLMFMSTTLASVRPTGNLNLSYRDPKRFLSGRLYSAISMIDKQLAEFLEEGIAIHLGTRNERLEPNGARVTAVTVEDDGTHLMAYVPTVSAGRVLPDLETNGQAALVFGRPTDDRACQVKGVFAGSRAATLDERDIVMAQWDRCEQIFEVVGIPRTATMTWVMWPCVAVRLRATALFSQTPGPGAGAPLA